MSMAKVALLGFPHDENSSYLRGPAEGPPLIRRELFCDAYSNWSETGVNLDAADTLVDHGDDPAYAPGVSHREPGGLSTRQVINLIQMIEQPIVGADIVEFNPRCDISNLTAIVAAKLVKEIGEMMVKTRPGGPMGQRK